MAEELAINLENISKTYLVFKHPKDRLKQFIFRGKKNYFSEFNAVSNLSLKIKKGETVGIVGCNGSGKSTLLQIICGVLSPSSGTITANGRISALLELGAGFNPEFTGRENIFLNASIIGLSKKEIEEKYDGIVEFSGLSDDHINQPVKNYSSGMYVRLAFAIAVAVDPEILVVDEALAVGDEAFQRKCFARIRSIQAKGGTIIFVSHSARMIVDICDRAVLLERGQKIAEGDPKEITAKYQKMIFAPAESRSSVIEEIKSGGVVSDHLEGMRPESTVEYESRGARISDIKIYSLDGKEVNILKCGQEYVYKYKVTFSKPCSNLRFTMMIKTRTGLDLAGSNVDFNEEVSAGERVSVSFRFKSPFLSDTYFTNCSCSTKQDGEKIVLHRIIDSLMFKVLPEDYKNITGYINISPVASVERQN